MEQKPLDRLLCGYFAACEAINKPFNGLQKMKIRLELQKADVNRVLEILEEIDRIKRLAKTHSISIDANLHGYSSTSWPYGFNGTSNGGWDNSSGGTK
jgi:hypothetical protein